jgi:TRAP-type C4-dicarboxylate transport system permease small subunit
MRRAVGAWYRGTFTADIEPPPQSRHSASPGRQPVLDKAIDHVARVIELALAVAFILAVLLNFTNVIGRYVFGLSLLGSDEVQVFIMVAMTFLGAAVVTRRNLHLRMDVLVRFLPRPVQAGLRFAEQLLLVALATFVVTQSYNYAQRMFRIGRTSDMAGVPMWIPHGTVTLGFALVLIVAIWGAVRMAHRMTQQPLGRDEGQT